MAGGEDKGWGQLAGSTPDDVCKRASVSFDHALSVYTVKSFNWNVNFSAVNRSITCDTAEGEEYLLRRLGHFYRLSSLWYLNAARDIPLSGQLAMPQNLNGGEIFFRGSHVLPLQKLSDRYESAREEFLSRGAALGGTATAYGDASIVLQPYPRVPVTLILWLMDDEFPARAECLLDTSCEFHLPIDIIWMVSMMCIQLMAQA
ncbi:MAG: DUF3786 domain-containing protein [Nitrospirae bacterium]|nr:DUF3786 domain-containing protein [Nitrospirota bacterium]